MTIGDIATASRNLVNANSTSYSNADFLIAFNQWYLRVGSAIRKAQAGVDPDDNNNTTYPNATRALVAAQRDYKFSDATWELAGVDGGSATSNTAITVDEVKRVDVTYDGTNWYRAYPVDTAEINTGIGNDTTLDDDFSKTAPAYDVHANGVDIYPLASSTDVTAGAKLRVIHSRPFTAFTSGELTTGTKVPGFFLDYHDVLVYGTAYEFALRHGLENKDDLLGLAIKREEELKEAYSLGNRDRHLGFQARYENYD